jgi:hypothetical protein
MVPEPPEGKASPCRPNGPQGLLRDSLVRFSAWVYQPSGDTKGFSVVLLRVWRGMFRQRGAAPGQARVALLREAPRVRRALPQHRRPVLPLLKAEALSVAVCRDGRR